MDVEAEDLFISSSILFISLGSKIPFPTSNKVPTVALTIFLKKRLAVISK